MNRHTHTRTHANPGWAPVAKMWQKDHPHLSFILPHAPSNPVTLNGGYTPTHTHTYNTTVIVLRLHDKISARIQCTTAQHKRVRAAVQA